MEMGKLLNSFFFFGGSLLVVTCEGTLSSSCKVLFPILLF